MSHFRAQESSLPPALHAESRRDLQQRDAVAHALGMLDDSGLRPAVEYLKAQAVRPRVIERVLLDPAHRRAVA